MKKVILTSLATITTFAGLSIYAPSNSNKVEAAAVSNQTATQQSLKEDTFFSDFNFEEFSKPDKFLTYDGDKVYLKTNDLNELGISKETYNEYLEMLEFTNESIDEGLFNVEVIDGQVKFTLNKEKLEEEANKEVEPVFTTQVTHKTYWWGHSFRLSHKEVEDLVLAIETGGGTLTGAAWFLYKMVPKPAFAAILAGGIPVLKVADRAGKPGLTLQAKYVPPYVAIKS